MQVCDCERRLQDIKACLSNPIIFTSNKYFAIKLIIMTAFSKFFSTSVIMALLGMTPSFLLLMRPSVEIYPY
jgi:hypothetical protein